MKTVIRTLFLLLVLLPSAAFAQQQQQQSAQQAFALSPPCQGAPRPAYGPLGGAPAIASWSESDSRAWQAAPCLQWNPAAHPRMVTALAATLSANSLDELLARYGALSRYNTIRYWSTLRQAWDEMVSRAGFVDGPAANFSQPDVAPEAFTTGREFYYYEIDHVGRTINRLTVRRRSADGVELATENLTPVQFGVFTIFEPHALRTATFIERRGPHEWGYYQAIGVGDGADFIAVRSSSPYINRLTALYRYMAGVPTDGAPPAAPR